MAVGIRLTTEVAVVAVRSGSLGHVAPPYSVARSRQPAVLVGHGWRADYTRWPNAAGAGGGGRYASGMIARMPFRLAWAVGVGCSHLHALVDRGMPRLGWAGPAVWLVGRQAWIRASAVPPCRLGRVGPWPWWSLPPLWLRWRPAALAVGGMPAVPASCPCQNVGWWLISVSSCGAETFFSCQTAFTAARNVISVKP